MPPINRIKSEVPVNLIIYLMIIFLTVIFALRISQFAVYVIAALVIYTVSQKKVEFTFFALMLLVSLSIMNPVFFKKGLNFYLVTRSSLLLLAIVMTFNAGFKKSIWFLAPFSVLYAYIAYIMLTSLAGWAPIISELKAILFLVFLLALTQSVAAVVQSGVDIRMIRAAMLVVSCFYILGSIATIPFPAIGHSMVLLKAEAWGGSIDYKELGGLFNGVTWHSQTLGPTIAMLNAFLLSDYLCNLRKKSNLYRLLMICVPILVYMTSSRTALFAYLISVVATILFFMGERRISAAEKSKVLLGSLLLGLIAVSSLVVIPGGLDKADAFLRKAGDSETEDQGLSMSQSLTASRMGLAEEGLDNFKQSPLIGNGFQVSKEMAAYDFSETGLILTAPIEKGILPIMVLEEGGVLGAAIFWSFILAAYLKYRRLHFTCFLSTFTVFLGLNSGEASFFSTSGGGGILWMICFCALLMDVHRHRRMLAEKQQQNQVLMRWS